MEDNRVIQLPCSQA